VLYQPLEYQQVRDAGLVCSRSVKIRCPGNGGSDISFTDLTHQLSRHTGTEVTFTTTGIVGSFFRHGSVNFSVHIDVVKKDQPGPGAFAGLDGIVDDPWPLLSPNSIIIFETDTKIDYGRAFYGLEGLIRIGEIGCQDSGSLPG